MIRLTRVAGVLAAGAITIAASGVAYAADTTVHVLLKDKGQMADHMLGMLDKMTPGEGMGMGMPGAKQGMGMAPMIVSLDTNKVKAGSVTFEVTNESKGMIHEMIVSPVPADGKLLPYLADENRVDEDAAGHLGEVSELDPGKSGALTLTLEPGTYIIFCNLPGHYLLGMWTTLTVEG